MNTYEFFMANFGRHLASTDELTAAQAAEKVLSGSHRTIKGTPSRLASGWAIVRPGRSSLRLKLAAPEIVYDERNRLDAFTEELKAWDGMSPRIFLEFDKAPLTIDNVFTTVDRRWVRVCSPRGVASFDMDEEPDESAAGIQRAIWNRLHR